MMNPLGKHYEGSEKLIAEWRKKRGGPLTLPTREERDCSCPGLPDGCGRPKCPRRA